MPSDPHAQPPLPPHPAHNPSFTRGQQVPATRHTRPTEGASTQAGRTPLPPRGGLLACASALWSRAQRQPDGSAVTDPAGETQTADDRRGQSHSRADRRVQLRGGTMSRPTPPMGTHPNACARGRHTDASRAQKCKKQTAVGSAEGVDSQACMHSHTSPMAFRCSAWFSSFASPQAPSQPPDPLSCLFRSFSTSVLQPFITMSVIQERIRSLSQAAAASPVQKPAGA